MASAITSLTSAHENLETYCLIWLDNYANSSHDNRQAQQQLTRIINQVLTFENEYQCLQHINNLPKDDRVILVASGRFGRQIVPQIVDLRQIISVYIYCMDKRANEQWAKPFLKVKSVVTRLDELVQQIRKDYLQQEDEKLNECLAIRIFDPENNDFLRFQLLIDGLIRLKPSSNDKLELLTFCKEYYQANPSALETIEEFGSGYSSDRAVWWFTRHTFLSRLLIKALRNENLDLLYKFRFFIRDLACQLGQHRPSSSTRVYRSQLISKDEIDFLKASIGKFLSINSFLLATSDERKCRSLLYPNHHNLEKVLFVIDIDGKLTNLRPFGNIQMLSYSSKLREMLFMIGSIFSIDQVDGEDGFVWTVKLTLCSLNHPSFKVAQQQLKKELPTGEINLFQFGNLLYQMGKAEHCPRYYCRYLNQLPDKHSDIPICYEKLAFLAEMKKNFLASLKWYKKALKTFPTTDQTNRANVHNCLANVYLKSNNYNNALKSYQKVLTIRTTTFGEKHSSLIRCWNNIGAVHDMKKSYSEALDCYKRAYELCKTLKDPDLALTARNLANTYELQGDSKHAKEYYEKALKLYQKCSSATNDIYIKDIQTSLQRISSRK